MSWFKKITDAIRGSEDFSDIKSSTLRDVLNGNILTKKFFQKQYGLLIMIAVLTFFMWITGIIVKHNWQKK